MTAQWVQGCEGCETLMNCPRHSGYVACTDATARRNMAFNHGYDAGQALGLFRQANGQREASVAPIVPAPEAYRSEGSDYLRGFVAGFGSAWT